MESHAPTAPDGPAPAITAYGDALRSRFSPYLAIIRERQGLDDAPLRDDHADAAEGERLRALVHARAPAAERAVAAMLAVRLRMVELVNHYAKAFRVGVADGDRTGAELARQLAQLDAHEREALAALPQ